MVISTYDINVGGVQLFERPLQRNVYVFCTIAIIVRLDGLASSLLFLCDLHASKLCSQHNLISHISRLHPFANPLLALAELVIDCCVNPITTLLVEVVQDLERCLFRALANGVFPSGTKIHTTERERRDSHCCCWAKQTMPTKQGFGFIWRDERHFRRR